MSETVSREKEKWSSSYHPMGSEQWKEGAERVRDTSSEADLQQYIEHYLQRINQVTSKLGLLNDETNTYNYELAELKASFDAIKAPLEHRLTRHKVQTRSLTSKTTSCQQRVNQIMQDISRLRTQIDSKRTDESHFRSYLSRQGRRERRAERERSYGGQSLDRHNQRLKRLLLGFNEGEKKGVDYDRHSRSQGEIILHEAARSKVQTAKNPRQFQPQLQRVLEPWQLDTRRLLKERIKRHTQISKTKATMIDKYLRSMESFDRLFDSIKTKESTDNIEEIVATIDRYDQQFKEMVVKQAFLDNLIDEKEAQVSKNSRYIMSVLENNSIGVEQKMKDDLELKYKKNSLNDEVVR